MIRGVRIGPSPRWMQNALRNVGLRPRNNVVDITNYVMMECGHPLHAFDYALLKGSELIVRQAAAGTPFTTLDGIHHTLPDGAVMICDAEREVSIAGVMGGENSEISDGNDGRRPGERVLESDKHPAHGEGARHRFGRVPAIRARRRSERRSIRAGTGRREADTRIGRRDVHEGRDRRVSAQDQRTGR